MFSFTSLALFISIRTNQVWMCRLNPMSFVMTLSDCSELSTWACFFFQLIHIKQSIMAAWFKAPAYLPFVYLLFTALLLVIVGAENSASVNASSDDTAPRSSVKKELRNPDKWNGSGISEEEEIEPIKGFYLDQGAQMLSSLLRTFSNKELGVTALQSIYDSLPFGVFDKDDRAKTKELSERLHRKLLYYWGLVNQSKNAIEELFWHHLHRPLHNPVSCSDLPNSMMRFITEYYHHIKYFNQTFALPFRFNSHFGAAVSDQLACDISYRNQSPSSFIPGHNLTQSIFHVSVIQTKILCNSFCWFAVFSNNLKIAPSIKWQYFLGADGGLNEFPAHKFDSHSGHKIGDPVRRRDLYFSSVHPKPQFVVMVIDHGSALSPNQLNIAKAIGNNFVSVDFTFDCLVSTTFCDRTSFEILCSSSFLEIFWDTCWCIRENWSVDVNDFWGFFLILFKIQFFFFCYLFGHLNKKFKKRTTRLEILNFQKGLKLGL